MRTLSAFLVVFVVASVDVMAQPAGSPPDRTTASVAVGVVFATLSSYQSPDLDAAFDTSVRTGVTFGGTIDVPFGTRLSLRPGAFFVQKGANIQFGGSTSTDALVDLRYVEFPILLQLRAGSGRVHGFVNGGPSVAFKLHASVDASASGGSADVDIDSEVRRIDAGAAVGGGGEGPRWSVELRLVQGVIDIGNSIDVDDVVRTRTISVLAGLRF